MFNTTNDFYYQVCDFGGYDVKILTERANEYNIHTADIIEYTFDNYSKDEIFKNCVSINYFFHSMFCLRINQLQEYTKKAIEEVDCILNNDFPCNDEPMTIGKEHSEYYIQTQSTLSTLNRLLSYLTDEAMDNIHINACCSCFDCPILDELECAKSGDDIINIVEQGRIYIPSN